MKNMLNKRDLLKTRIFDAQIFEIPINEINRQYTKNYSYMKHHPNYIKMSSNAKVVLDYMKEWALNPKNEQYLNNGEFEFASSLISNKLKLMSDKTARYALLELQHYGFIEKTNNAGFQQGIVQKWKFSCEWQYEEKSKFKKTQDLKSNKKIIEKALINSENIQKKIMDMYGYLYVIKLGEYYKIGVTQRPEYRLKEFTKLPHELIVIILEYVENYDKLETQLHKLFFNKKIRGEWFNLNNEDIIQIKEFIKGENTNFKEVE